MGVEIPGIGGDILLRTFSDNFNRPDIDTWGTNWIRTLSNTPGGGGNGQTGWAQIRTNAAQMVAIAGAGASQFYQPTWIPLPVFFNVFNLAGYFIQYSFVNVVAGGMGACLRYNHNMLNTVTQAEGSDFYVMIHNGRIDKLVGGGVQGTIGAATWVPAANDVLRFEVLTVGATVRMQSIRNGAILQTITDSSATRILQGGPAMQMNSAGATGQLQSFTNFSCGPLSALST